MLGRGRTGGGWARRLAVSACALGLLVALPAAASAKEVAVAVSLKVLVGNTTPNNCAAAAYLQWPAQAGAEKWRLEYLWNGKLEKRNPKPPFDDAPHSTYGWAPPGGSHWYLASIGSKSASEDAEPVDCGDHEAARLNAFGGGTIFITVPDDPDDDSDEEDSDGEDPDDDRPDPPGEDEIEDPPPPPKAGAPKCRGQAVTIFAQPGTPTNGTPRRDVILGTPGRDVIRARGGNDLVCALPGNDLILGGGGRDVLIGQGGATRFVARGPGTPWPVAPATIASSAGRRPTASSARPAPTSSTAARVAPICATAGRAGTSGEAPVASAAGLFLRACLKTPAHLWRPRACPRAATGAAARPGRRASSRRCAGRRSPGGA